MTKSTSSPMFISPVLPHCRNRRVVRGKWTCSGSKDTGNVPISRRSLLIAMSGIALGTALRPSKSSAQPNSEKEQKPLTGFQSKTGLKYFDFVRGDGPTPTWGDLVNIHYVAYTISASGDSLVKQDSSYDSKHTYLLHHGNGEQILGLEEAIHSMNVGGRRRAIMSRDLAYYMTDLGPVPTSDFARKRFSKALENGDGTVVFDIELVAITADPDDRGYYNDLTPTEEEVRAMMNE